MTIGSSKPTLADKRKQWLEVLSGKDQHSIINQITQMAWDAAAFRVVNKARGLAPSHPEGGVQLNGLMHQLLDRGFSISQTAAVRRLMDTAYSLEDKKRGVYSLAKLLEDMCQYHHLFTRQAIFDAEGLEHDYKPIRQKAHEYGIEQRRAGKTAYFVPASLDSFIHENRHEQIDRLAGVKPSGRRPDDTIQKDVFSNLTGKVKTACEDVENYVTKFIAHAAAPGNRTAVTEITLNHLDKAHRNLCQVTSFIGTYILGDSCPPALPIPQYNQFKYIERPLIDRDQVGELKEVWNQFDRDCHDWSQWGLDDYDQEFGKKP